jgi:hypothetical protein
MDWRSPLVPVWQGPLNKPLWQGPFNENESELDNVVAAAKERLPEMDSEHLIGFYGTGRGRSHGSPIVAAFVEEVEFRGKKANELKGFQSYRHLALKLDLAGSYFPGLYSEFNRVRVVQYPWRKRVLEWLGFQV